jgi:hypothetical protein
MGPVVAPGLLVGGGRFLRIETSDRWTSCAARLRHVGLSTWVLVAPHLQFERPAEVDLIIPLFAWHRTHSRSTLRIAAILFCIDSTSARLQTECRQRTGTSKQKPLLDYRSNRTKTLANDLGAPKQSLDVSVRIDTRMSCLPVARRRERVNDGGEPLRDAIQTRGYMDAALFVPEHRSPDGDDELSHVVGEKPEAIRTSALWRGPVRPGAE